MIDLLLMGMTQKRVAEEMCVSKFGLCATISSPIFQAELGRRRSEQNALADEAEMERRITAKEELESAKVRAVQTQVGLLDSENPSVRQKAAMDILDRTGLGKKNSVDVGGKGVNVTLTMKDLERINMANQAVHGRDFDFLGLEEEK